MLDLIKNETFLNEYNSWFTKINKIKDENQKNELMTLLKELANEVKSVDTRHQELLINRKNLGSADSKSRILELRKKIASRVDKLETKNNL